MKLPALSFSRVSTEVLWQSNWLTVFANSTLMSATIFLCSSTYNTIQYNKIEYNKIQYNTVLQQMVSPSIHCTTVQYNAKKYNTTLSFSNIYNTIKQMYRTSVTWGATYPQGSQLTELENSSAKTCGQMPSNNPPSFSPLAPAITMLIR